MVTAINNYNEKFVQDLLQFVSLCVLCVVTWTLLRYYVTGAALTVVLVATQER
jgi:hypothetical protein